MAMFGGSAPSLADIAAVTRNNDGNNNGGLGDGNGWWVLIILFALFGGWGNNGYGRGNGGSCGGSEGCTVINVPPTFGSCFGGGYGMGAGFGFSEAALQRGFDNQTVIQKLNGLENGVCDLGYNSLVQTNGLTREVMQTGFSLQQAINDGTVSAMRSADSLSHQISDCCCDIRSGLKDIMYTMATDTCAMKTEVHQTGDTIIQNQNAGFQMLNNTIRDGFTNLEMQAQNRYIAELERKLNACDRDSALQGMANYVINQVRPTAVPSWSVPNPYAGCGCNTCGGCCA